MKQTMIFTSESVTEGHPDKLCDQISDAIVDRFLKQDPDARIRTECAVSSAILFIAARFSSSATVDLAHAARKVIKRIGYDQPDFNANSCSILASPQAVPIDKHKPIPDTLSEDAIEKVVVKNQVTLFGYACDHSPNLMPLPISLAHELARQLTAVRKRSILPYLAPDGKIQVGVEYQDRRPTRIHSVTVTANQRTIRNPGIRKLRSDILEAVIKPVLDRAEIDIDAKTSITVNPDGPELGGPAHHSGLTGRKNAIDTYGEFSRHSGKALSGKDPLRIDRVGAYAARNAAKNVVAAGLASECEVMLSYSIGFPGPVSLHVHSFGTGVEDDARLTDIVRRCFDFRLAAIVHRFNLKHLPAGDPQGFYAKLAVYGHFGRPDLTLPWEATDSCTALQKEM
jgi:S-adenosylmethionine synthetase